MNYEEGQERLVDAVEVERAARDESAESGKVIHVLSGQFYDVYVGRAMPRYRLKHSPFANSLRIGRDGSREEVLRYYEQYALDHLGESPDGPFATGLRELRGKILACWCAPRETDGHLTTEDETVCHGQVLLRLAEELA